MPELKGVCVGAGYFSQFHYDAWPRIGDVVIVACCDLDPARAQQVADAHGIQRTYSDFATMLDRERPDFVDIITPPATHVALCRIAAERGVSMICQKPLAPALVDAREIVATANACGVRFMVHENFRFQPWYREIKRLLDSGEMGQKLHSLTFRSRPGDGWGEDAYLGRQPYFREMPRLLIYETGIHFIDTFRFLAGDVARVWCRLRKLNPVIAGEDCGLAVFDFEQGAVGLWDANRFNESNSPDPRYTFGEFLVETDGGSIRLAMDGTLTLQPLGQPETMHDYHHERRGFGGDCCYFTQRHFIDRLLDGRPFETGGDAYLKNLVVQEALYESAAAGAPVEIKH